MAVVPEEIESGSERTDAADPTYSPALLEYQLRRRGKEWKHLRDDLRLRPALVTALRRGVYPSSEMAKRIAGYLRQHSVDPELDALLERPA
jgi:hypothetical protein